MSLRGIGSWVIFKEQYFHCNAVHTCENRKLLWCFKILADRLQKRKGPRLDLAPLMVVLSLHIHIASLLPMMCVPVLGPRNECTVHVSGKPAAQGPFIHLSSGAL